MPNTINASLASDYVKPTQAQADAGNYRMGHIRLHGLDISIETPKGKRRRPEWPRMAAHYGYIKKTTGKDGDHVDVFVGPDPRSQLVVVVDQVDKGGSFDEHKVLLGFSHAKDAIATYKQCYSPGWKVGRVTLMTMPQFRHWLNDGSQRQPIADQVSKYAASETVTGKHGDKGRYVTTEDGNQIFITESGTINRTGKPVSGQTPEPKRNRPQSIPKKTMQHPGGGVGIDLEGRLPSQQQQRSKPDYDQRLKSVQQRRGDSAIPDFATPVEQPRQLWQNQKPSHPEAVNPSAESHPLHHSQLPPQLQSLVLQLNGAFHNAMLGVSQAGGAAKITGTDPAAAKKAAFEEVDKSKLSGVFAQLKDAINEAGRQNVNLRPFIRHNNIIPRELTARLKPNDQLFRPVRDSERFAAACDAVIEYYASRRVKSSPGQMEFKWITVHPHGPDEKGQPVLINSSDGTIQGGMGGQFNGEKIGDVGKSKGQPSKSINFGDVVKDREGLVGIMTGSSGMASNRVGVLDSNGQRHWRSRTELEAATESDYPKGKRPHRDEWGQTRWVNSESSNSNGNAETIDQTDKKAADFKKQVEALPEGDEKESLRSQVSTHDKLRESINKMREAREKRQAEKAAKQDKPQPEAKQPEASKDSQDFNQFDPEKHGGYKPLLQLAKDIDAGKLSIDDFKAAHAMLHENRDSFIADLQKRFNAKQLQNINGNFGDWDAKRKSKSENAEGIYKKLMVNAFDIGDGISTSYGMGELKDGMNAAALRRIAEHVEKQTDESLAAHVEKSKARAEEREAAKQAADEAKENPKTLEDFNRVLTEKSYLDLQPEQRRKYDELAADKSREKRKAAQEQKATVQEFQGEGKGLAFQLSKNFHSKRGTDIFTASPTARVDRDSYNEMNAAAKRLGGWYYKEFRGTPAGFHFPTEEARDKFLKLQAGDVDRSDDLAALKRERQMSSSERLTSHADRLEQRANETLAADRKTNTARRAGMAAAVEGRARRDIAHSQTMRTIAEGLKTGNLKYLDGVSQSTHLETLNSIARRAAYEHGKAELVKKYGSENNAPYRERERLYNGDDEATSPDVADHANYPYPTMFTGEMRHLTSLLKGKRGVKHERAALEQMADKAESEARQRGDSTGHIRFSDKNWETFKTAFDKVRKAGSIDRSNRETANLIDRMSSSSEAMRRLQAAGIHNEHELRQALREYIPLKSGQKQEDPVKKAERALVGRKIPGFFPTPPSIVDKMLAKADIQAGHEVFEPSAGKGDILDAIRDSHPDANVKGLEFSREFRDVLGAKGHDVDYGDFLEHKGKHDRIVMNPPFEGGADMKHVRHAYEQLKPGGKLVAIMASGGTAKRQEFDNWVDSLGGEVEELPAGSFAGSDAFRQTGVNTKMVTIQKPSDSAERYQILRDAYLSQYTANLKTLEQYAAKRDAKNSPGQMGFFTGDQPLRSAKVQQKFKWITVHPNGAGKGQPVMIDDQGVIQAGMGGKFTGKTIGEIKRSSDSPTQKPKRKSYEDMKAEVAALKKQHGERTAEGIKAYGQWLRDLSPEETKEYLEKDGKERRFAHRSKAAKKGVATKQRKAQADVDMAKDPAGKIVQDLQAKRNSLMKRWQSAGSKNTMADIEKQLDATEKPFEIAQHHYRLRQNHKNKRPNEIDRNRSLPKLGSAENKQETSGTRDANLIPWSVGYESGHGETRYIIAGASLSNTDPSNKTGVIHLKNANGTDSVRDGLLLHFDRGDAEKNKRARQLVWAINNGMAQDASLDDLQRFVMGDSLDHHHPDFKQTPRGARMQKKNSAITQAMQNVGKRDDEGSWDADVRNRYGARRGPHFEKQLGSGKWMTANQLSTGPYKNDRSGSVARDLKELVKAGLVRMAWDSTGMPHYAKAGTKLPSDFVTKADIDANDGEFPVKKSNGNGISENTLRNEDAKPGDQMGLFGEGTRAPRKKSDFSGGKGKARQTNLIDGLNSLPGQMSLIDEAGAPDDMVHNAKASTKNRYDAYRAAFLDRYIRDFGATLDRYRTAAKPQNQSSNEPKTVVGNFGDRGRFVTTEDGNVIFITTDGTVNRGPKGLKGTKVDTSKAKERKRVPKTKRPDTFSPKTRLDHAIVDAIGDHPDDVNAFREFVGDAHKLLTQERNDVLDGMRNLLSQFGYNGKKASRFLSSLKRQRDYSGIAQFDEMADYARKYHPELLSTQTGASDKSGDDEALLFKRLKEGFPPAPSKHDPEVIELASEMAGTQFMGDYDDYTRGTKTIGKQVLENPDDPFSDFVPFAASFAEQVLAHYHAAIA